MSYDPYQRYEPHQPPPEAYEQQVDPYRQPRPPYQDRRRDDGVNAVIGVHPDRRTEPKRNPVDVPECAVVDGKVD